MLFVNSLKLYIYISHKNCTEVQMCGYSVSFIKILGVLIYHSYLAKSFCFCCFSSNQVIEYSGTKGRFLWDCTKSDKAGHLQKVV